MHTEVRVETARCDLKVSSYHTCRTWPSGVTFNRLVSSSCINERQSRVTVTSTYARVAAGALFPRPLTQRIWPTEAGCGPSEARSRTMTDRRGDTRRDAAKRGQESAGAAGAALRGEGRRPHHLVTPHASSPRQTFDLLVAGLTLSGGALGSDPVVGR